MAIDQSQLLQMLLQGGGGGPETSPTSGLQAPSLSGLGLGPQGMGFGGGESLMGGGAFGGGFGGGGGGLGGLDIAQLMAQLQAAPGVTGAGLGTGIGAGSLGAGSGVGAGGALGGEFGGAPSVGQSGQAGLGTANTAAQLLGLLKEGTGLGKVLTNLFPKGPTPTDLQGINQADLQALAAQNQQFPVGFETAILKGFSPQEAHTLTNAFGPLSPQEAALLTPQDIAQLSAGAQAIQAGQPFTSSLEALGPGGAPALAGELGPGGTSAGSGFFQGIGGLSDILGGAGVLSNLGFGALNLSRGNLGSGLGGVLGTGAGLGIGAALAPETLGLSLLLGGLGGGVGGLFGGLFGGGGPSAAWRSFGGRLAGTVGAEQQALTDLDRAVLAATAPQGIQDALSAFRQQVQAGGVGGYASAPQTAFGPPGYQWAPLPGAGGSRHEGGVVYDPDPFSRAIGGDITRRLGQLQQASQFQQLQQQRLQKAAQQTPVAPSVPATPAPGTPGIQGMNLPGSGETNLLTLLQRMGMV